MKEEIVRIVEDNIKDLNLHVDDAFENEEEGQKVFNIVLDSDEPIDLNRITEASKIINEQIKDVVPEYIDVVDIHSKEKGN